MTRPGPPDPGRSAADDQEGTRGSCPVEPAAANAPAAEAALTGWGRATTSLGHLVPVTAGSAPAALRSAGPRGALGRGMGRSYGDAALNSGGTLLRVEDGIEVDARQGLVTARAGATFEQLLRAALPHGWSLPVLPGTRQITLGGAIAADVHGKNHLSDGSLAGWVTALTLLDGAGQVRELTPEHDAFWATLGGMGLTGVVLAATVRLTKVASSFLSVTNTRGHDLEAVLLQLERAAHEHRWAVAWVDGLARGPALGRGIVSAAELLPAAQAPTRDPLAYDPPVRLTAPRVPRSLVTPLTARAFNELWWRRGAPAGPVVSSLTSFFHPLDAITGWNRAYGPRGFLQYQLVVPVAAHDVLRVALERIGAAGGAPFLGVLKRFGAANRAPLSFPRPGWSLAVDLPHTPGLAAVLDGLDEVVAGAGGAIYLAKDARLRPELLATMYPQLDAWRQTQAMLDPHGRMRSDLDRRLKVVKRA